MSLDFHIGYNKDDAEKSVVKLAMSEEVHNKMFGEYGVVAKVDTYLIRLNDYYCDASYMPDEIILLQYELEHLINDVNSAQDLEEFLVSIIELCQEARKYNKAIFVFSD